MLTFLAFIFVLSFLIFVHEFGHYIIAKLSGIGVERFSIGMPPRLLGVQIGETEYCISAIPFGGYVKLTGQDDFSYDESEYIGPGDYRGKPTLVKIAVLVAGSIMNILTAVFIFFILFWIKGVPESTNQIGYITPGTVAEQIGLKSGDEIVALNGKKVEELEQALFSLYTEQKSTITVRDSFGERTVEVNKKLGANEEFGVVPYLKAQVDKVLPESPADQAGFKSGDVIAAINGELITGGWYHMSEIVRANPDRDMIFTLERDGEDIQCQVRVGNVVEDLPDRSSKKIGRIGISPLILNLKVNGFESIIKAVRETGFFAIHTIDFFIKLVTGRMSAKLLGGPVLIAQMAGESAKTGLANLLFFTAFISINLGVLNLLPFPVLDGGHIFILLIETVIRRKLSTRIRMAVQQVGSIILLLFMIYITFNDIMRFDAISRFLGGK